MSNKIVTRTTVSGPLISQMTEAQVAEALTALDTEQAEIKAKKNMIKESLLARKVAMKTKGTVTSKPYRRCNRTLRRINDVRNALNNRLAELDVKPFKAA